MKSFRTLMKQRKGIAIYIAVTITAALVLVSFAILNLAIKQVGLSSAGRDSQLAFYAADSGVECALWWDIKRPTNDPDVSAFATSTTGVSIGCFDKKISVSKVGNVSTFNYDFSPNPYCVAVTVTKGYDGEQPTTKIESKGYNTCVAGNSRRVERAIRVEY